jgi:hypothetical protein
MKMYEFWEVLQSVDRFIDEENKAIDKAKKEAKEAAE